MPKPKVSIGIPYYGGLYDQWWVQFVQHVAEAAVNEIDFQELLAVGSMATDHNRNIIADDFLKSKAEWLFWIDSDTVVPIGAISRLLAVGKTLVSGIYYGKDKPHPAIAYYIFNGAYKPIDQIKRWEAGEIIPVDACGMGCMLTHRSVFEDIKANFEVYQREGGGQLVVHTDDIVGGIVDDAKHPTDGKVINGQYRERLRRPTIVYDRFPFFMQTHLRTEDLHFFELARRVGHKPWLDTVVECSHLRIKAFTGGDFRDIYGH